MGFIGSGSGRAKKEVEALAQEELLHDFFAQDAQSDMFAGSVKNEKRFLPSAANTFLRSRLYSLEAEQSLIGALLVHENKIDEVLPVLSPRMFYFDEHRVIFEHIVALTKEGVAIDLVTVSDALEKSGALDRVGGFAYLAELANSAHGANVRHYAKIIADRYTMRKVVESASEIIEKSHAADVDVAALLGDAQQKLLDIAYDGANAQEDFVTLDESIADFVEDLTNRYESEDETTGVASGYTQLDEITSGWQAGDMIIIAARPAMGKTTFALNLAEHVAINERKPVVFFSLEMPAIQITMRLLASLGRIDLQKLKRAHLDEDDWGRISAAIAKAKGAPFFICDKSTLTPFDISVRLRRLTRRLGMPPALVVIDYLQLLRSEARASGASDVSRVFEISEISRAVKLMAKEIGVPVLALSQLNRGLEQRPNKRPMMSDLRESGALEQDADLVLFIYRDEVYHPDTDDKGVAEIIIGKHRNGPTGTVKLLFNGNCTRFDNYVETAENSDVSGYF